MLEILIIILLMSWLLGISFAYTLGGLIHILLVIAIIAFLVRVINGPFPGQ